MGKIFETSDDVREFIETRFKLTKLHECGVILKIMSIDKSKELFKLTKASQATEFLLQKDGVVQLCVYEALFDRLDDKTKELLTDWIFSFISYDYEKSVINIQKDVMLGTLHFREISGNVIFDALESIYLAIESIEQEEKERKENEKRLKHEQNRASRTN